MVLPPKFVPRIWGSRDLSAWYPGRGVEAEPVGEVWLTPAGCPVLIKLLFPREKLSVQVHPDDGYAAAHGMGRGKSEMWVVLEAEAGAKLGVGLRAGATLPELEAACRCGRGAEWLDWISVGVGDVVYVPAGTVHAIGPGVVLCEVQQPSDNTFRLDDYGRPRELHLERGFAVARVTTGGRIDHGVREGARGLLLRTPFFQVTRGVDSPDQTRWVVDLAGPRRGQATELRAGEEHDMTDLLVVTVP